MPYWHWLAIAALTCMASSKSAKGKSSAALAAAFEAGATVAQRKSARRNSCACAVFAAFSSKYAAVAKLCHATNACSNCGLLFVDLYETAAQRAIKPALAHGQSGQMECPAKHLNLAGCAA